MTLSYWIGHRIFSEIAHGFFDYRVIGREHIERHGGALIVCNHQSYLDPPFVGIAFDEAIHFLARKTLFRHPVVGAVLRSWQSVPVDQERPDTVGIKAMVRLLRSGEKVLIFPEGERTLDGKIKTEGEPGVGMIVSKAGVPVLPVRLFGPEKALPRGSSKLKRHPATLVVGEMITLDDLIADESLSTKDRYQAIANRIMDAIRALELRDSRGE